MRGTIQTIGYTEPDAMQRIATFLAREHTGLVDIRKKPASRWYPAFNKKALVEQFSLKYGHCPELGNLNYKLEDREKGIVLADPDEGIRRVMRLLENGVDVLLLCACKDYEHCHRKVVYELLQAEIARIENAKG